VACAQNDTFQHFEHSLGIPTLLRSEDVASGNTMDVTMMTYLALIYDEFANAPLHRPQARKRVPPSRPQRRPTAPEPFRRPVRPSFVSRRNPSHPTDISRRTSTQPPAPLRSASSGQIEKRQTFRMTVRKEPPKNRLYGSAFEYPTTNDRAEVGEHTPLPNGRASCMYAWPPTLTPVRVCKCDWCVLDV
jgi:hypothetical protein